MIRTSGGVTVHTHLKMDGFWRVRAVRPGVRPVESFKLRLILANAHWEAAGYLLGVTEVIPTADEEKVVGHLGPDLLGPDWDQDLAVRLLSRDPDKAIGEALLDQRNLARIGDVCAPRAFLRASNARRAVGSIEDLPALVDLGHRLLDANKTRPGHVTTGDTRRGKENWVYGRAGEPCRRCGTQIKKGEQGPRGRGADAVLVLELPALRGRAVSSARCFPLDGGQGGQLTGDELLADRPDGTGAAAGAAAPSEQVGRLDGRDRARGDAARLAWRERGPGSRGAAPDSRPARRRS